LGGIVQVNMLEAKNHLSRLVKAALDGQEVIIASHGKAQVRLVPCVSGLGLQNPGALALDPVKLSSVQLDEAFSEAADLAVAQLMGVSTDH
jgi:prevent-host-death family protein